MKVLVTGSRTWKDRFAVEVLLAGLLRHCTVHDDTLEIIDGDAKGADAMAQSFLVAHPRVKHATFGAKWDEHDRQGSWSEIRCHCGPGAKTCKAAGIRRNVEMLNYLLDGASDDPTTELRHPARRIVLAFHDDLGESKGTGDMVKRALAASVRVYHFRAVNGDV